MDERRATYQDVIEAPEHVTAELIDGRLVLSARPAAPHLVAATYLGSDLLVRFDRGRGGPGAPGGWRILDEPELWLGRAHPQDAVVVPDVAGWRRDRYPVGFRGHGFTVAPDLVVEVLSPSTHTHDRFAKAEVYARAGVPWMWLVDPLQRTVEVFALRDGAWLRVATSTDDAPKPLPPFEVKLEPASWWEDASEPGAASG